MQTNQIRRLTLFANLATHFQHRERMQITARIEIDAEDVAAAIQNYVREKTGRDIKGDFKVDRERGGLAFSVPAAYDLETVEAVKAGS